MAILPIGFFMPLPLAMMIPFMGTQSAVMMKQAGENWQYGKRLQSAMSNEEFNAQTTLSIFQKNTSEIRSMIPTMKQSIQDMRGFQDFIIVEMIELMRRGLETGLGAIFGLTPQQSNEFFGGTTGPKLEPTPTFDPENPRDPRLPPMSPEPVPEEEKDFLPPPKISKAFIPPLIDIEDVNSAPVDSAIARIIIKSLNPTVYVLSTQQTPGNHVVIETSQSRTDLMTLAAQFYPSPKYFPSFRNDNTRVYYFRVQ